MRDHPYTEETIEGDIYLRVFSEDTLNEELKWHWDEEDRMVTPIRETDWKFQMDNKLPQIIEGEIFIPAGEWHRVIKGTGNLLLRVHKIKK
jgi:hypothetical protein